MPNHEKPAKTYPKASPAAIKWVDLMKEAADLGVRFYEKDNWFWRWLEIVLSFLGNYSFVNGYIQTIGRFIFLTPGWIEENEMTPFGCNVLAHELEHVRQFKSFGLGSPTLGILPMGFYYCLFPLPIGFCWGRWDMESQANLVGERTEAEVTGHVIEPNDRTIQHIYDEMTGPSYLWCMSLAKGYVRRWLNRHIAGL